ncbi:MAG: DDE-type integrase/transposase/recombinase [Cyanobacteria bacterium P01_H01_bin.15]
MDKNSAYLAAVKNLTTEKALPWQTELCPVKYLNNQVEQDHRFIKRTSQVWFRLRLVQYDPTLKGCKAMAMIRKELIQGVERGNVTEQISFICQIFGTAV